MVPTGAGDPHPAARGACGESWRDNGAGPGNPPRTPTGGNMNLILTEHETEQLRGMLEGYLPELRREVARTDKQDLRRSLLQRLNLVENLLERLAVRAA